jgi:hypothetical protein
MYISVLEFIYSLTYYYTKKNVPRSQEGRRPSPLEKTNKKKDENKESERKYC